MPKQTLIVTTAQGDQEVDVEVPTAGMGADSPDAAWSKGFHEALKKDEPYAGMVYGAAKGVIPGAVKGAWDFVKFLPYTAPKALLTAGSALYTDPVGTLTKVKDTLVNAPKEISDAYEKAIQFAATDPEAFGEQVGEQVGALAGGAVAGKFTPVRSGVRLTGKALQAAGEHPFAARMSGGAMLGRGVLKGDVPTAVAGVTTMALPKALTTTGKFLREISGEDLSGNLPSGVRNVADIADVKSRGIRVAPPTAAPARGVPLSGEPAPVALPSDKLPSGARTLDVGDISSLGGAEAPGATGSVRTAIPGSSTGPAPYRATAKAAVKADESTGRVATKLNEDFDTAMARRNVQFADEQTRAAALAEKETQNANKLAEINRRKEGLVPQKPTVNEGLSAVDPNTGVRASSNVRFTPPKKMPLSPEEELQQYLANARAKAPGTVKMPTSPRGADVRAALTDETGRPIGGAPGPRNPAQTGAEAPVVPKDAAVEDAAKRQGVRVSPPKPTATPVDKLHPRHDEFADLADEINDMRGGAEEIGTQLARKYPDRFKGLTGKDRINLVRSVRGGQHGLLPPDAQADIDVKLSKMRPMEAKAYFAKAPTASASEYIAKQMKVLGLLVDEE